MKNKNRHWLYPLVLMGLFLMLTSGCTQDDPISTGQVPVLTTSAVISIEKTTATSGGNISSDGGSTVTARGVCWSTGNSPTISDNKTSDGDGLGSFTSNITGLTSNTTYYVRAYATNSEGTGYGSSVSFTSLGVEGTVTDIDGNVYEFITIGTQVWTVENLKVTHFNDGAPIPNVTPNAAWQSSGAAGNGAYCDYDNDDSNVSTYGRLYNWHAVNAGNLAPVGWHVPTQAEWQILVNYLGGNTIAGGKMKEAGFTHWGAPNTGATNESGFTALPGGSRYYDGGFSQTGAVGFFWSSTEQDNSLSKFWRMSYQTAISYNENHYKSNAYSVRCVKD